MENLKHEFLYALRTAILRAGSQTKLAEQTNMHQSRISDYLTERYHFENITIGTLMRIFPDLRILYFQPSEITSIRSELYDLKRRLDMLYTPSIHEQKVGSNSGKIPFQ